MLPNLYRDYSRKVSQLLSDSDFRAVHSLAEQLRDAWAQKKRVYVVGNGGSAANAMHFANDLLYGIAKGKGNGLRVTALTADPSIMTCLANDISYDEIFSQQLKVHGSEGDVLVAFSGSGNSPNIVNAIMMAKELKMKTFAVLGYSGGKCLKLADTAIHFAIDDMQIAEDMQLIVGHMVMRWLCENRPT